ncbi:MAG TPA: hypothetical protein VFJ98_10755 [Mycobacteriales bacterium]|nr:hypothetical protein [Mycobacteriales bacterium]
MTPDPLTGHVVVLAAPAGVGEWDHEARDLAAPAGAALLREGVLLAVVTTDTGVQRDIDGNASLQGVDPPITWRANPADPSTWGRLAPHIEQRMGPVDAVVVDPAALEVVRATFGGDMRRRGHGAIVMLSAAEDPVQAIRRQLHRPP